MRVCIFSDLQACEGSARLRSDPSASLQLWRVDRFYDRLSEVMRAQKCDAVWDAGDCLDDRTSISYRTLKSVAEGSDKICRGTAAVTNFKLIGNHEQHLKNTLIHAGHVFKPHFHVIEDRGIYRLNYKTAVVAAAFPREDKELAFWIQSTILRLKEKGDAVIFIGHFQLKGCKMPSGPSISGIPTEALAQADVALLGHVHNPQSIGNIHYVGSPFQQDFGEAGDSKRVAILDTQTLEVTWVPMEGFPTYRAVEFADLAKIDSIDEDRIRVSLRSPAETEAFYRHPLAGQVEAVYAYSEQAKAVERETVKTLTNPVDMLGSYVSERPLEGFETSEISRYGREIMGLT